MRTGNEGGRNLETMHPLLELLAVKEEKIGGGKRGAVEAEELYRGLSKRRVMPTSSSNNQDARCET